MPPDDLMLAVRKRPFEPFRILVFDGSTYDIHHPELVMVGLGSAIIGVQAPGLQMPFYQRYETVALQHVVKLIPLASTPTSPGNGQ